MKKFFRNPKGVTLIELLVVVVILGILATVTVPNVARFMGSGDLSAAQSEAAAVQTATDAYLAYEGKNPTTSTLISKGYFRGSLKGTYTISNDGAITDNGSRTMRLSFSPNYPTRGSAWSAKAGLFPPGLCPPHSLQTNVVAHKPQK